MSKGVTITFPDSEKSKFERWVKTIDYETEKELNRFVRIAAYQSVSRAKQFASRFTNYGFLEGSIGSNVKGLTAEVFAGDNYVKYAPYVEFGTGTGVVVGPDTREYAMTFKGKGLRKVNNRAQPYFFPAIRIAWQELQYNLNKLGFK